MGEKDGEEELGQNSMGICHEGSKCQT